MSRNLLVNGVTRTAEPFTMCFKCSLTMSKRNLAAIPFQVSITFK